MNNLKIHDIKTLVEVPDNSFYFFILLILVLVLLVILIIYFIYKKIKNKKINMQKIYIQELKNIDISKSKNAAYSITKYVQLLARDGNQKILCDELILELNQYKYRKESTQFSEKTIELFKKFKGDL